VTPGQSYFIALFGHRIGGHVDLSPIIVERPANDDFATATVFEGERAVGIVVAADDLALSSLTSEADEPSADPAHPGARHSAWWKWTAPRDGVFTVASLADAGWFWDVDNASQRLFTVGVFQGETLSTLTRTPGIRAPSRSSTIYDRSPGRRLTSRASASATYYFQAASPDEFGGISVSLSPGDAYDQWAMSFPALDPAAAGPDNNPGKDGLSNLLKFCLGLNPTLPVFNDPNRDRAPVATYAEDGEPLDLTFWSDRFNTEPRWLHDHGSPWPCDPARVVAQMSTDLVTWTNVKDAKMIDDNRWRVRTTIGKGSQRFIRLKAEWCQPSPSELPVVEQ
jgi:hypothetical protein